jgi:hypothetical protein
MTPAQIALFIVRNSSWKNHGGDRRSDCFNSEISSRNFRLEILQRYAKPGFDLNQAVGRGNGDADELHRLIEMPLKDGEGNKIPNTRALLPEAIDTIDSGQTETVGRMKWLAGQTHEDQRLYVKRIKFKGKDIERRSRALRPSLPFSKKAIDDLTDAQAYVLLDKIWNRAQRHAATLGEELVRKRRA